MISKWKTAYRNFLAALVSCSGQWCLSKWRNPIPLVPSTASLSLTTPLVPTRTTTPHPPSPHSTYTSTCRLVPAQSEAPLSPAHDSNPTSP
ncbi:unnamed protein product [Ectocarpus sp. CCAP 1310/34]|nr:unnamed protein product [Ectocarpus sp. CCAP 1310/34]